MNTQPNQSKTIDLTPQEKKLAQEAQEEQFQAEVKMMKEQKEHLEKIVLPLRRLQTELVELQARTAEGKLRELKAFAEINYGMQPDSEQEEQQSQGETESEIDHNAVKPEQEPASVTE